MKLLLTILLIFTTLLLSAQTPDYFSDNPKWRQRSSCAIPYPCIEDQEFVYYLNGDSIVDNFTYKKVYKRGELTRYPLAEPPSPCFGSWTFDQFHTLLRQDEKRIYIRTIEEDLHYTILN